MHQIHTFVLFSVPPPIVPPELLAKDTTVKSIEVQLCFPCRAILRMIQMIHPENHRDVLVLSCSHVVLRIISATEAAVNEIQNGKLPT
jgi:hypothetical protein